MSKLLDEAKKRKKLERAGDAAHDPADLSGRHGGAEPAASTGRLVQIPLDDLTSNPQNLRDLAEIEADPETAELAASMALLGQQQPAVVISRATYLQRWPDDPIPTPWVVMMGNRRRVAARKNGWATLECVTRDRVTPDLEQLGDLAIHENVHRKNLNPLRVAYWLHDQVEALGTEQAVADKVGKSQPWVNQHLQLLKLTPSLQQYVQRGEMNASAGRALARLPRKKQHQVAAEVDAMPDRDRAQYWRTRAWTPTDNTEPATAPAPHPVKDASPPPGQRTSPATEDPPAVDATPSAPVAARPTTVRVRVDDIAHTAADLRKHLDADQVSALAAALKRRRLGQAGRR